MSGCGGAADGRSSAEDYRYPQMNADFLWGEVLRIRKAESSLLMGADLLGSARRLGGCGLGGVGFISWVGSEGEAGGEEEEDGEVVEGEVPEGDEGDDGGDAVEGDELEGEADGARGAC